MFQQSQCLFHDMVETEHGSNGHRRFGVDVFAILLGRSLFRDNFGALLSGTAHELPELDDERGSGGSDEK